MNRHNIEQVRNYFGGYIPTDREEFFKYTLENMDSEDVLSIHNDWYCDSYPDDYIYENDEYNFNEWMGSKSPYEVAMALEISDWDSSQAYFKINGYGNIESFDYIEDEIDYDELADYLVNNPKYIEDYVDDEDIILAFSCYAESLTDEEIDGIDAETLINEDWDDVIEEIIDDREEEEEEEEE